MKIGACCGNGSTIRMIHELGYDFAEVNNWNIYKMNEESYAELLALKNSCREGFFYACNGLVPGDLRLTGPDVNFDQIRDFSRRSFERLARLGVKMLTFGSSKAKKVPEDFPFEKAYEQLVTVTQIFADAAKELNMQVCIEPLRRGECNIINTAEDSIKLAEDTKRDNVGGHVDLYHLSHNGEDLEKLVILGSKLVHTHIAHPESRHFPLPDDGIDYVPFFDCLRRGGYDGTVSFEGRESGDPEVYGAMLNYLRSFC